MCPGTTTCRKRFVLKTSINTITTTATPTFRALRSRTSDGGAPRRPCQARWLHRGGLGHRAESEAGDAVWLAGWVHPQVRRWDSSKTGEGHGEIKFRDAARPAAGSRRAGDARLGPT